MGGIALASLLLVAYNLTNLIYPHFEDGALFTVIGRWMLDGLMPYRDMAEQKPPAIFVVTALTVAVLGKSSVAARLVELVFIAITAVGAGRIVGRLRAGEGVAVAIATCGVLFSSMFWDLNCRGQVEVFEAAPMTWGVYFAIRYLSDARRLSLVWSGLLLALACWFKPQAALLAISVWAALSLRVWTRDGFGEVARASLTLAGAALAISSGFIVWMWAAGMLDAFVETMFTANAVYLGYGKAPTLWQVIRSAFSPATLLFRQLIILGFSIGGLLWALARRRDQLWDPWAGLIVGGWLLATFLHYFSGRFLFDYHKLLMLPPLAVLFSLGLLLARDYLAGLLKRWVSPSMQRLTYGAALVALLIVCGMDGRFISIARTTGQVAIGDVGLDTVYRYTGTRLHYYDYHQQRQAADHVRERTKATDRVQVLGRAAAFHLHVDRRPATRYLLTGAALDVRRPDHAVHHARLMRELQQSRPAYILFRVNDFLPWFGRPSSYSMAAKNPDLWQYLRRHYVVEGTMGRAFLFLRWRTAANAHLSTLPERASEARRNPG